MFDLQHQLPADMPQKVDLAGMMHSLEVRVPFFAPTVVELAVAMSRPMRAVVQNVRKKPLGTVEMGPG